MAKAKKSKFRLISNPPITSAYKPSKSVDAALKILQKASIIAVHHESFKGFNNPKIPKEVAHEVEQCCKNGRGSLYIHEIKVSLKGSSIMVSVDISARCGVSHFIISPSIAKINPQSPNTTLYFPVRGSNGKKLRKEIICDCNTQINEDISFPMKYFFDNVFMFLIFAVNCCDFATLKRTKHQRIF